MKPASPVMLAILNGASTNYMMADIWAFNLTNGVNLYYTNADIDLTLDGTTYKSRDVLCEGGKVNWETGLTVGTDEITMYPNEVIGMQSTVGTLAFSQAILGGLFDHCLITRSRLFMTTWGDTTPGAVVLFVGQTTDSKLTQNTCVIQSKDLRNLLNISMPSQIYQPTCPFVFGDSNCGFNRASIAVNSSVAGIAGSTISCGLSQAAGFFNNGTIKFTSGQNAGWSRSVKSWQAGLIQIVAPFPVTPAIGDAFTITPGCTKNFAGAQNAFAAAALNGSTPNSIITSLTNAPGYFNGGTLQFTSGVNVGQVRTITNWQNGIATLSGSFSNSPGLGDECEVTQISTNTTNSCTGHFGSAASLHFGGQRFLPVPETSY